MKYFPIIIAFLIACADSTQPMSEHIDIDVMKSHPLDSVLQTIMDTTAIVGFGVAVVTDRGIEYARGFGYSDLEAAREYSEHTTQNIASISKTFIGMALAKAEEMGILRIGDPVNMYLPFEIRHPLFPDSVITVRHLATHTSGITDSEVYGLSYRLADGELIENYELDEDYSKAFKPDTTMSMMDFMEASLSSNGEYYDLESFTEYAPGSRFEYSNMAATLAAAVVESASQMSFASFCDEHIFNVLGMYDTSWSLNDIDLNRRSRNYGDSAMLLPYYRLITYPDGGLNTSAHDLALFMQDLIAGSNGAGGLLKMRGYQHYFHPNLEARHFEERDSLKAFNDEYNMGLFIGNSANGYWGHTGGDPGTATLMFFDPVSRIGQLLLINSDLNRDTYLDYKAIWKALSDHTHLGGGES